jgi:hypothetical protein
MNLGMIVMMVLIAKCYFANRKIKVVVVTKPKVMATEVEKKDDSDDDE